MIPRTPQKPPRPWKDRLAAPAGKTTQWDGRYWSGTFTVLDSPQFKAKATSESELLHILDDRYRAWLAKQPAEVKAEHTAHLKKEPTQ